MISQASFALAAGSSGRQIRRNPKVPTLSSTPTSRVPAPTGASVPASGSQVCSGTSGALMANAMANPAKIHIWVDSGIWLAMERSVTQSKVPAPAAHSPDATYRPITEASISRPPSSEYRKNFVAAYARRTPPNAPIRKYIGISMTSNIT